jgi:lysophospholipase L1-like esterase
MRRRPRPARVRALVVASLVTAVALTGCSQSGQGQPEAPESPNAPPSTSAPAPTPAPTSTLRKGTASDPLRYAALGDSYSAGVGGGAQTGRCQRSPNGYPHLLAKTKTKTIVLSRFVACSGATTSDVIDTQIDALDPQIDLVTITIGGNDLDVSVLPSACAQGETPTCKAAVTHSLGLLHKLPAKLAKTYKAIAKAAPRARILVADYPLFYDLPEINDHTLGSEEFSATIAVDAAVASLDATIANAVEEQRTTGTDIRFVDVSFKGHGINSKKPWFVLAGLDAYHPTSNGYQRYAETLSPFTK